MAEHGAEDRRTFVIFRVGPEEYGVAIERVRSIIRYEPATPVPRAPDMVEGVINMRGNVIPVIDLSRRLSGLPFDPGVASRIIVADAAAGTIGLAVDAANEVASIAEADIKPAPEGVLTPESASAICGVTDLDGRLVILLDLDETVPVSDYAGAIATNPTTTEGGTDV